MSDNCSLCRGSPLHDAPTLPCPPLGHAFAFAAAKHASENTQACPAVCLQRVLCISCLPVDSGPTACRIMSWTSAAILLALGFVNAQYPLEQGIVPNDQYTAAPAAPPLGTDGWRTGRSTFFDGSDTFKNAYIARYISCLTDTGLHCFGRTHAWSQVRSVFALAKFASASIARTPLAGMQPCLCLCLCSCCLCLCLCLRNVFLHVMMNGPILYLLILCLPICSSFVCLACNCFCPTHDDTWNAVLIWR